MLYPREQFLSPHIMDKDKRKIEDGGYLKMKKDFDSKDIDGEED